MFITFVEFFKMYEKFFLFMKLINGDKRLKSKYAFSSKTVKIELHPFSRTVFIYKIMR